jgi:hypothetical protein
LSFDLLVGFVICSFFIFSAAIVCLSVVFAAGFCTGIVTGIALEVVTLGEDRLHCVTSC